MICREKVNMQLRNWKTFFKTKYLVYFCIHNMSRIKSSTRCLFLKKEHKNDYLGAFISKL